MAIYNVIKVFDFDKNINESHCVVEAHVEFQTSHLVIRQGSQEIRMTWEQGEQFAEDLKKLMDMEAD